MCRRWYSFLNAIINVRYFKFMTATAHLPNAQHKRKIAEIDFTPFYSVCTKNCSILRKDNRPHINLTHKSFTFFFFDRPLFLHLQNFIYLLPIFLSSFEKMQCDLVDMWRSGDWLTVSVQLVTLNRWLCVTSTFFLLFHFKKKPINNSFQLLWKLAMSSRDVALCCCLSESFLTLNGCLSQ